MSMTISSNVVLALLSGLTVTDALKVKAETLDQHDTHHDAITHMLNHGFGAGEALRLTKPAAGGAQLHSENFAKPVQEIRKDSIDSAGSGSSGATVNSSVESVSSGSRSVSSILNFGGVFGGGRQTGDQWILQNIKHILFSNHPDPKYAHLRHLMSDQGFEVKEELMDFTMDAKRAIHETWLHPRDDKDLSTNLPEGRKLGVDSEGRPSFKFSDPFIKDKNGSFVLDKLKKMEREAFDAHYEFLAEHVDVLPKKKAKGGKSDAAPIFFKLKTPENFENLTKEQKKEHEKKTGFVVKIFPKGAQELAATEWFMADLCRDTRKRLSALTPYLSLHTVKWGKQTRLVAVMPNVAHAPEKLSFDVTEKAVSEEAAKTELDRIEDGLGGSPIADIKGNPERGDRWLDRKPWQSKDEHAKNIDHQLNLVIADSKEQRLAADPQQGKYLMDLLKRDTAVLEKKGLTDYSLIINFYDEKTDAALDLWKVKGKAVIIDYPMRIDEETPMSGTTAFARWLTSSATKEATPFWWTWVQGIDIVMNGTKSASGLFTIGQRAQTPAITRAVSDAAVAARAHNLNSISFGQ